MAYTQKDNTGALFVNARKLTDNHPDREGSALIEGKEYWVSGWVKDGKTGKWLSLAFKPKDKTQAVRGAAPGDRFAGDSERAGEELDDEIPF